MCYSRRIDTKTICTCSLFRGSSSPTRIKYILNMVTHLLLALQSNNFISRRNISYHQNLKCQNLQTNYHSKIPTLPAISTLYTMKHQNDLQHSWAECLTSILKVKNISSFTDCSKMCKQKLSVNHIYFFQLIKNSPFHSLHVFSTHHTSLVVIQHSYY